jgi:DNA polymerase III delta prime subunit
MTLNHLDKNNFHHAYLIEGRREEILLDIFSFMETSGIETSGNPDFYQVHIDNFKMDEALELRSMAEERSFTANKKVFVVSANHFSLDAQHALLKMFEEPILNTHFFILVPDVHALLKTLISRFYVIKSEETSKDKNAERFVTLSFKDRIDFIKDLLKAEEEEDEEGNEIAVIDSNRSKALRFLNELEFTLHNKIKDPESLLFLSHFFKVREFLRMPGSSTKSLMESIALVIPEKI